ncbi:MAG: hypothetical protein ACOZNI_10655 [Myxococcota bacterium]
MSDRFPSEESPRAVGVEPVLLDRLLIGAETARSDALFVVADGRLVAARTFGGEDAPRFVRSLADDIAILAGGEAGGQGTNLRPSDLAALGQALVDGGTWTGAPVVPEGWTDALALPTGELAGNWTAQPDPTDPARPPVGFGHVTDDGEALLMYPEARLVVVRTMRRVGNRYDRRYDARDRMEWLDEMAESIAVEKLGRPPLHE